MFQQPFGTDLYLCPVILPDFNNELLLPPQPPRLRSPVIGKLSSVLIFSMSMPNPLGRRLVIRRRMYCCFDLGVFSHLAFLISIGSSSEITRNCRAPSSYTNYPCT